MHDMDSWWYSMQHGLCMKWLMVLQVTQVPSSSGLVCGVKLNYGTMQCPVAFRPVRYSYGLVHWNGNDQPGEQEDTDAWRWGLVWLARSASSRRLLHSTRSSSSSTSHSALP